jgi:hypothetical protein
VFNLSAGRAEHKIKAGDRGCNREREKERERPSGSHGR